MRIFNIKYLLKICIIGFALSTTSCSYVMDSIEGAITNRASFGINVTKTSSSNYTISWDLSEIDLNSEAFAGFEVYLSDPNDDSNESLLIAGQPISGQLATSSSTLLQPSTSSINITTYTISTPGIYFFRVGVIYWDYEKSSDRINKWGAGGSEQVLGQVWSEASRYSTGNPAQTYYIYKTKIGKISGSSEVSF